MTTFWFKVLPLDSDEEIERFPIIADTEQEAQELADNSLAYRKMSFVRTEIFEKTEVDPESTL